MKLKTDDLIRALVDDERRGGASIDRRALLAAVAGLTASVLYFIFVVKPRPDLAAAIWTTRFDFKLVIMAALAVAAGWTMLHLARPDADRRGAFRLVGVVLAMIGLGVIVELAVLTPQTWLPNLVGRSAIFCLETIPTLALPTLIGMLVLMREGASTRPAWTGAAAGLFAGACGGFLYGVHCPDDSPLFVATWYTIAIAAMTALGALLGSRLLRW